MLIEHRGFRPTIAASAIVASTAVVSGKVTIGEGAQVLHGAVITAEDGSVSIGTKCVIMENALIRGRAGHDVRIGDAVLVGPHAHVNGAVIGDEVFIATGASVFPGATIGDRAEIRINAVVQVNTAIAADAVVPISWVAVGKPAQLFSPDRHDEISAVQKTLDFVGTVYGAAPGTPMRELMRGQSDFYSTHRDDRVLDQ